MNLTEDYKVRYERIDGSFGVSEWDNERGARRFFNSLKNEKVKVTWWAELIWSPIDEDDPDAYHDEYIVDDFMREKVEIMGRKLLI